MGKRRDEVSLDRICNAVNGARGNRLDEKERGRYLAIERGLQDDYRALVDGVMRTYGVNVPVGLCERLQALFLTVHRNAYTRGLIDAGMEADACVEE